MNSILTRLFARKICSLYTIVAKAANFTACTQTGRLQYKDRAQKFATYVIRHSQLIRKRLVSVGQNIKRSKYMSLSWSNQLFVRHTERAFKSGWSANYSWPRSPLTYFTKFLTAGMLHRERWRVLNCSIQYRVGRKQDRQTTARIT